MNSKTWKSREIKKPQKIQNDHRETEKKTMSECLCGNSSFNCKQFAAVSFEFLSSCFLLTVSDHCSQSRCNPYLFNPSLQDPQTGWKRHWHADRLLCVSPRVLASEAFHPGNGTHLLWHPRICTIVWVNGPNFPDSRRSSRNCQWSLALIWCDSHYWPVCQSE